MERSDHRVTAGSRRKRRRRRRRRRRRSKGRSSLEVKENQDDGTCDQLGNYRPAARAAERKQPPAGGSDRAPCRSHSTRQRAAWAVTRKNALVQLNELRPGLRYEVTSKAGPLHGPVFSVGVEVNGLRFEGRGPTKKRAKMRAAELALRSFVQFPNAPQAHSAMEDFTAAPADFTADKLDPPDAFLHQSEPPPPPPPFEKQEVFSSIDNHKRLVDLALDLVSSTTPTGRALRSPLLEQLSPVALLQELRPGLRFACLVERVRGRLMRSFVVVVRAEGRVFEGCGPSKRRAKAQAAAAALLSLYDIRPGAEQKVQSSRSREQLPQFFVESISRLVREKLAQLTDSCCSASRARHKVLAGIVMTRGFDLRSAHVVSLATGTKCLDNASDRDSALGDCHAEVLCRRALVRFLYSQLELLLSEAPDEQSIFVASEGGGLRLQDGVSFHMYVSSSPCGDARLNCPYETTAASPGRRCRSHLRVKVNGGEGTLPVTARGANQTRPATMSCTDKMAKWSVVGLQGALLSHLVEPVYLHSLTVGTLSHTGHLGRALTRRLAAVKRLPLPYRRRQPLLSCLSEVRPAGRAPGVCLTWSRGGGGPQVISTSTGRREGSGTPSQLSRSSLFHRWQGLRRQISGTGAAGGTYGGSKTSAGGYQGALQQFTGALQGAGLGTWLRKSPQLGHVTV